MDDRHLTVNQIANTVGISRERVENILHNELGMSKISARWIPWPLAPGRKLMILLLFQKSIYLQKGRTINGAYYANLPKQLRKAIQAKRPGKWTKGVLFHQKDVPSHNSVVAMAAVHDCGFTLLDHPLYSPDLGRQIIFCFRTQKGT